MKIQLFILLSTFAISMAQYNQNNYQQMDEEAPSPKLKFNIGFNVPSMSISLPKLELPQISIRASIKQRKPFELRLPQIRFTKHVTAEEDEEEEQKPAYKGNAQSYDAPQQNNYGQNNGYKAASSYERPATQNNGYGNQNNGYNQEEANAYGAAPQNNNVYQPAPQQNYATGFQGQAVSDYKSSASNYYAPQSQEQPRYQNFRQQDPVQAYNSAPVHSRQVAPQTQQVHQQYQNEQQYQNNNQNYGQRVHQNQNQNNYQRRSQHQPSPSAGVYQSAASELRSAYILSEPLIDYSSWRPIRLNNKVYA